MTRGLDIDDREHGGGRRAAGDEYAGGPRLSAEQATGEPANASPTISKRAPGEHTGDPGARLEQALSRGARNAPPLVWRERLVTLAPSESATLRTLGAFRTVALSDLARHQYDGDSDRAARVVRRLERQHFVDVHTLPGRHGGRAAPVVTLTREGHALTREYLAVDGQRTHSGVGRPKEQAHDAALYRVGVKETQRLADRGAIVRRVVLDAELKGQLAAARSRASSGDPAARTLDAARALHLQVVGGHVQLPDLRLEYEAQDGSIGRVDLELATEHYKPDQVVAKATAGFTIYAPASQTARLAAALQDRGLVADIFSL